MKQDKTTKCIECKKNFLITAGEQEFYSSHHDDKGNPFKEPRRCKECRQNRRNRSESPFREVAKQVKKNYRGIYEPWR